MSKVQVPQSVQDYSAQKKEPDQAGSQIPTSGKTYSRYFLSSGSGLCSGSVGNSAILPSLLSRGFTLPDSSMLNFSRSVSLILAGSTPWGISHLPTRRKRTLT